MPERKRGDGSGRRDFLKTAGLVGATILVGVPLGRWLYEQNYTGEGNEEFELAGELLEGGEIVDDQTLAEKYLKVIEEKRPLEPDPTIVRSTLYNAMRFFGTNEKLALRRSNNVSISEIGAGRCFDRGCVYDTSAGFGAELGPGIFYSEDCRVGWILLSQYLSHEAYHLSVKRADDRPSEEDYGVLGKYLIWHDKRGFSRGIEEYKGEVADLINRTSPISLKEGEEAWHMSVPEEFFAELGKIRFYKYLLSLGLGDSDMAIGWKDYVVYPHFQQGIVNAQDTEGIGGRISWQEMWGRALEFKRVDKLHYLSDRFGLYEGVGEKILGRNKNQDSVKLSKENTAALGAVAFTDFVDYDLTKNETLTSLIQGPIKPSVIVAKAKRLYERIQERENATPDTP